MTQAILKAEARVEQMKTGLDAATRQKIADGLVAVLADTYTLLIKTHVFHWNVVGPLFLSLHELTEKQYGDLFEAADIIAERIRALGHTTPLGFDAMLGSADVREEDKMLDAAGMVRRLIADHEKIVQRMRELTVIASDCDDFVSADMLTERLTVHEKAIWMLRAIDT